MYSWQFSKKNFLSPKMAATLNFRFFAKNGKTQICFYLLNRVRFRRNFRPTGYLNNVLLSIFKKKFLLPKNGGHFESWQFSKNFTLPKNGGHFESWQFSENFILPKNGGHFEFSKFLPKKEKQIYLEKHKR